MPSKTNLFEAQIDNVAKWLSCNGEVWGMGPTAVFASAAALFLYNELEETVFVPGDVRVSLLEKTLVSTMVLGMLALMVHLWVCSMRFFQYYLDTIIKDSPGMLLEMTTVGLLGGKSEIVPLGPLMRFLRQQQPQIHITVCWFLSLCYADYVRKHYCQRFNMPYLEQWQTELQARASRGVQRTVQLVSSFVSSVQTRLQVYAPDPPATDTRTPTKPLYQLVMVLLILSNYVRNKCILLLEWSKCGDSSISMLPTILWAIGSAAVAHRLITALLKRFVFRRVPAWEVLLQHLIYIWMVIYSLHFWAVLVKIIKYSVESCYKIDGTIPTIEAMASCKIVQQVLIWMCSVSLMTLYIQMRTKAPPPPLMIWITTNPWHRREMGAYEYYLNRPLPLESSSPRQHQLLRKTYSDAGTLIKEQPRKRRMSKSV